MFHCGRRGASTSGSRTVTWRPLVVLALLWSICSCYMYPTRENRPIAQLSPEEAAITRAVMDGVLADLRKQYNVSGWSAFYIELPGNTDPPDEWLKAYADYPTTLMPASLCVMSDDMFREVVNRKTGRRHGLLISIGQGVLQADQTILSHYCWHDSVMAGQCGDIELKQEDGKWVVIKTSITIIT